MGVRWNAGEGSCMDPVGDVGEAFEPERVMDDGANVCGECAELGETGE